jgi:hypothetical protein
VRIMKTLNNHELSKKPWLFQPGNKFGKGRPKGSFSLKTFAKKYLEEMNDTEKLKFMEGLPKDIIWKMAEGNPHQDVDQKNTGNITITTTNYADDTDSI